MFEEDLAHDKAKTKRTSKVATVNSKTDVQGLNIEQDSLINRIAKAVLDVSKKDLRDDQKLSTIKNIMIDLYMPALSMIEDLELKLSRIKREKTGLSSNEPKIDIDTDRMLVALEERVQELNQSNCSLERSLVDCQRQLDEYKTKLKDYDSLKESQTAYNSRL